MKNEYMNRSFYQMWYFICAMELGSYSKASQKLNVTQSAISKTIQNIEQNLQVQLFAREKNILVPTEAGKSLYRSWKDVISAMQESVEVARRHMGGDIKKLNIGVLDIHKSEAYLWEYMEKFREQYPGVGLDIESERPEILHRQLMENELDVIFTVRYDMERSGLDGNHVAFIKDTPLTVCMRTDHPLRDKDVWTVEDLKTSNLVVISALHLPSYQSMLIDLCRMHGFLPNIVYNVNNASSLVYNLHEKNDVFICDRYHKDTDCLHIVSRPIADTHSGVAMLWRKNDKQYLREFLNLIRNDEQR